MNSEGTNIKNRMNSKNKGKGQSTERTKNKQSFMWYYITLPCWYNYIFVLHPNT